MLHVNNPLIYLARIPFSQEFNAFDFEIMSLFGFLVYCCFVYYVFTVFFSFLPLFSTRSLLTRTTRIATKNSNALGSTIFLTYFTMRLEILSRERGAL